MKIIAKCILLSLMAAISLFAACEKVDVKGLEDDLQQILVRDTVYVKDTVHIKDTVMLIGANVDKVTFPHEGGSFCISIDSRLEYEVETGADWVVIGENCSTPSEALHVIIEKKCNAEDKDCNTINLLHDGTDKGNNYRTGSK